jgi:SAM-dependent methyltransferase
VADNHEELEHKVKDAEPYEGYWEESYSFVFRKLGELVEQKGFSRALEFGCGRGEFFERYARKFEEVIAVESDWDKRNKAIEEAYWNGMKHIRFKSSEGDGDPLERGSLDLIFIGHPMRHMSPEEADETIQKSRDLLKDGGVIVMLATRLKKGQQKFLEVKHSKEGNYSFEGIEADEFNELKAGKNPAMLIRRFEKKDFDMDGLNVKNIFYYHDTILPGFVDRFGYRDRIINLPVLRKFFGSEMMVILEKQ